MKNLHVISHTHWDREWYHTFQQFRLQLVHLIDNLFVILDSDPNYLYYMLDGQTVVLEDYLRMRPENTSKLKKYIQEGRILIGPWYVLPDEFLVSSEATVRNLLVGKEICEQFGRRMMIGYLPDPFGHIGQMPQILRGFGIDTSALWRGVVPEMPTAFTWQAPDGSQVLLGHLYYGYGNIAHWPVADKERSMQLLEDAVKRLEPHSNTSQYLMMQGTDHLEPHPETSEHIRFYNENNPDKNIAIHSTLPAYFTALKQEIEGKGISLPVHIGELRDPQKAHMLPGVLSTRMWIKQRNWFAQTMLERWVEPFSVWAETLERGTDAFSPVTIHQGTPRIANPGSLIRESWRTLMKNHAHDSICGCSVDETHEDMVPRFDKVDELNKHLLNQSTNAILSYITTTAPEGVEAPVLAITVFNGAPVGFSGMVQTDITIPFDDDFDLRDENGNLIEKSLTFSDYASFEEHIYTIANLSTRFEQVNESGYNGKHLLDFELKFDKEEDIWCIHTIVSDIIPPDEALLESKTKKVIKKLQKLDPNTPVKVIIFAGIPGNLVFYAKDVPAFGYKTYWLCFSDSVETEDELYFEDVDDDEVAELENEWLKITLDRFDGSFSILDKRNGAVYENQGVLASVGDRGDEYNFTPTPDDSLYLIEVKNVAYVPRAFDHVIGVIFDMVLPEGLDYETMDRSEETIVSRGMMLISLDPGQACVDISVFFENNACDHRLAMHFDVDFPIEKVLYDGHFDIVERPLDLPEFDESWREHPRPEQPQGAFVDVLGHKQGLMIANQGLPEVAVKRYEDSDSSSIAITLLRAVSELSRSDLFNRFGHAGPEYTTPAAQMLGKNLEYNLRIIPHDGNSSVARSLAYAFQSQPHTVVTRLQAGDLPSEAYMIDVNHPDFHVTAIKEAEDKQGYIVRGYNQSGEPILVNLRSHMLAKRAAKVRLDEAFLEELTLSADGAVNFEAQPKEIVTVYFGLKA